MITIVLQYTYFIFLNQIGYCSNLQIYQARHEKINENCIVFSNNHNEMKWIAFANRYPICK